MTRVLRRDGYPVERQERLLDMIDIVPLTEMVLMQAEAIGPHVKTLDAIHLSSALATGLAPAVVTHDTAMARVARELGLATHDPLNR